MHLKLVIVGALASITAVNKCACYLPTIPEMGRRQKCPPFFVTSDLFISAAFTATIAIKICKIIFMIRKIDWHALLVRARGCARGKRTPAQLIFKICKNHDIMGYLLWLVGRAQVRAQTFDARH